MNEAYYNTEDLENILGIDLSGYTSDSGEEIKNEESSSFKIPENSKSLEVSEITSRFSSAIWFNKIQEKDIILAGLGGIGSYVAFLLSRLNVNYLYLYDPDIVESVNMSGQFYTLRDAKNRSFKTQALNSKLADYSNFHRTSVITHHYDEDSIESAIMICGFDNMAARKLFFYKWLNYVKNSEFPELCLFIDGRLNAEEFQIFCIQGNDTYNIEKYEKEYLFDDNEADETTCSYKQTSFMANMIASVMVNLFVNFVANQCDLLIPRDLPFYTNYIAETMYFKTIN